MDTDAQIVDYTRQLAVFTLWLVIATGILALIALCAAVVQAFMARSASQRQLRAYVSVSSGSVRKMHFVDTGNSGLLVSLEVRNSGQTPGYVFRTWMKTDIGPTGRDHSFEMPTKLDTPHSIIGTATEAGLRQAVIPISQSQIDALNQGTLQVLAWGRVEYVDAFGRQRFLTFRCQNGALVEPNGWSLGPHKLGYDAN